MFEAKGPDSDFKRLKNIIWRNEEMMRNSLGFEIIVSGISHTFTNGMNITNLDSYWKSTQHDRDFPQSEKST